MSEAVKHKHNGIQHEMDKYYLRLRILLVAGKISAALCKSKMRAKLHRVVARHSQLAERQLRRHNEHYDL